MLKKKKKKALKKKDGSLCHSVINISIPWGQALHDRAMLLTRKRSNVIYPESGRPGSVGPRRWPRVSGNLETIIYYYIYNPARPDNCETKERGVELRGVLGENQPSSKGEAASPAWQSLLAHPTKSQPQPVNRQGRDQGTCQVEWKRH